MIRSRIVHIPTISFVALSLFAAAAVGVPPSVNGKLDQLAPFRVLRVWGTPEEMGFAHGCLVGGEYVDSLEKRITEMSEEYRPRYMQRREAAREAVSLPEDVMAELEGMIKGIEAARGGLPQLKSLDRPFRLDDLVAHNAADLVRAFGCSGFTVWGERAGRAGVITARNLDLPADRSSIENQLILVRQPSGRHQVATITWPGLIAAFTGLNDAGVCAFAHNGTGDRMQPPEGKFTPVTMVLKELLETSGPGQAQANAEKALKKIAPYPLSYMVRVVTPRLRTKGYKPARVFRIDAAGLSENPMGRFSCITTNHYLDENFQPAESSWDWSEWEAHPPSVYRYNMLSDLVNGKLTDEAIWKALREVATHSWTPTLHSMVVYPELRRLEMVWAYYDGDIFMAAPGGQPTPLSFDQLFAPPD